MINTKIVIVGKREYAFKGKKGEDVSGVIYTAFNEKNQPFEFSSRDYDKAVNIGLISFDEKLAISVPIAVRLFDGQIKYSEVVEEN